MEEKLKIKKVNRSLKELSEIKRMIIDLFPENERMPMWLLLLNSKRKSISFNAYYDKDYFVGFSFYIMKRDSVFVLYLAVNDKVHSKGIGSRILTEIKNENPGKAIFLNVEPIDDKADNSIQRERRLNFYRKNGFYDSHYYISNNAGAEFLILSTLKEFKPEKYRSIMKSFCFGLYCPKLKKLTSV